MGHLQQHRLQAVENTIGELQNIVGRQGHEIIEHRELIHRESTDRDAEVNELEWRLGEDMKKVVQELKNGGAKERQPMVSRRGFETIGKFDGEMGGFHDWVFQLKGFIRMELGFEDFLLHMEALEHEPAGQDVDDYGNEPDRAQRYDEQLYMLLVNRAVPESKALSVLRNCESQKGYRGALAWH